MSIKRTVFRTIRINHFAVEHIFFSSSESGLTTMGRRQSYFFLWSNLHVLFSAAYLIETPFK